MADDEVLIVLNSPTGDAAGVQITFSLWYWIRDLNRKKVDIPLLTLPTSMGGVYELAFRHIPTGKMIVCYGGKALATGTGLQERLLRHAKLKAGAGPHLFNFFNGFNKVELLARWAVMKDDIIDNFEKKVMLKKIDYAFNYDI
ncbi:hypothetical protein HDU89_005643 [Geranomyces variabilis]|nr:hypothetical protein HDU89_005643 [Geranomyces variabilis]